MEDQIAELQRLLAESEGRAAEEQRRREVAEERSRPKNLIDFLRSCHKFSINLQVITDKTLTTQGDTTKPSGRLFPQRIVPWDDFPEAQEGIWDKIAKCDRFTNQQVYPSQTQLDYVQQYIDPISSELGLRQFARDTVENPVRTLIQEMHNDPQLRHLLGLDGTLLFESHTNLGKVDGASTEEGLDRVSLSESHISDARGQTHRKDTSKKGKRYIAGGDGRAIKGIADQFCIYQQADGQSVPTALIEYKAPHKLSLNEIVIGLRGEIRPAKEIIHQEGESVEFLAKSLLAAVVTQLFSAMIGKGVRRGYIFTGEAIIFLDIPNDPSCVRYHIAIPPVDFQYNDENRYHRTSVAQITTFALGAVATEPPSQSWYDAAAELDVWAFEYINILKEIPETIRKGPFDSTYKPSRWKGFTRSPIRTRSRRAALAFNNAVDDPHDSSADEGGDNAGPPTPTLNRALRRSKDGNASSTQSSRETRGSGRGAAATQDKQTSMSRHSIRDRPYCTHQCLLGLASGKSLDAQCPNILDHGGKHLPIDTFLALVHTQLADDRGPGADCVPLYIKGSRGALVKVRLSSRGYTLVAKAMTRSDRHHLLHEAKVYNRLKSLQGRHIPVCLGLLDLELPYYYDHGIYFSMLLLSWAGRPLFQCLSRENRERILDQMNNALGGLHHRRVLHKDVELRNWVWDGHRVMLIDFERAEIREKIPLQELGPNHKEKRQSGKKSATVVDEFAGERRAAKYWMEQHIV